MIKKLIAVFIIVSYLLVATPSDVNASSQLLLSQITAISQTSTEVKIFNPSAQSITLDNWQLQYSADVTASACGVGWPETSQTAELGGTVPAGAEMSLALEFGLASTGSLRLVFNADETAAHDLIGWGETQCAETSPAVALPAGTSLARQLCEARPIDTDNNAQDFTNVFANEQVPEACPATPSCTRVIISEVSPTTTGAQSEFVELHNPTDTSLDISGCLLQSSAGSGNQLSLEDQLALSARQYQVFESLTMLDSGGEVWLSDTVSEERLQTVPYQDMSGSQKGYSLAWTGQEFSLTTTPTPGAPNQLTSPAGGQGSGSVSGDDELAPCGEGKYRSPETNRCRNIELATADLTPCEAGEERNPVTNRCRKTTTATASLAPCDSGQERNPATNRCRKIGEAENELKPCEPGQERNPETNRCRKAAAGLTSSPSGSSGNTASGTAKLTSSPWARAVVGLAVATALSYGAYEYRSDVANWWRRVRGKADDTTSL